MPAQPLWILEFVFLDEPAGLEQDRALDHVAKPNLWKDWIMALSVIGSGFGRTGTKSLKDALELLGFGPCHHMYEVISNPERVPGWQAAFAGKPVDWTVMYEGYGSQVDWPGAHFWRQAFVAFPDAKVVHSVRPEEKWWASFQKTIAKFSVNYKGMPLPPHIHEMMDATYAALMPETFHGDLLDHDRAIAAFRKRTEDVKAAIPKDRLLVFDVAEGWGPLCAFLNVPVPDEPFPHQNLRKDFWEVVGGEPSDPVAFA